VDGVDGLDAVVAAGRQVGADAAVAGEGCQGMPVARDRLMAFRSFDRLLTGVVRSSRELLVMRVVKNILPWCV
jgi:hypothetical protein